MTKLGFTNLQRLSLTNVFKHFFRYFKNIGLVAPEIEGFKFLRKCSHLCRNLEASNPVARKPIFSNICMYNIFLGHSLEDRKSEFFHAAAKKFRGSGNLLICCQDICCLHKCHHDSWYWLNNVQETTFKVWSKLGH